MLDVVNNLNDVMHASFIVGYTIADLKRFGRLLKRDQVQMTKLKRSGNNKSSIVNRLKLSGSSETNKCVEIFLFEKAIIICKRKSDMDGSPPAAAAPTTTTGNGVFITQMNPQGSSLMSPSSASVIISDSSSTTSSSSSSSTSSSCFYFQYFYQFKELLLTNQIGLTENLKNDKKKFEIWSDTSSYIFEASTEQEKLAWTAQIKLLLEFQLNEIKSKYQTTTNSLQRRSSSLKKHVNVSSSSSSSASSSPSAESESIRANSVDCDFDKHFRDYKQQQQQQQRTNSVPNSTTANETTNSKVVTIHHHNLDLDVLNSAQVRRRISNDLPSHMLTIEHDKIMTF
jgi:hypothetical protein